MAEEEKTLTEEDLMIEANGLIQEKDAEIKELKLKLAKRALYNGLESEDGKEIKSEFDINEQFDYRTSTNLEIAERIVNIHQMYLDEGREVESPVQFDDKLTGSQVAKYLKECIEYSKESDNPNEMFLTVFNNLKQKGV